MLLTLIWQGSIVLSALSVLGLIILYIRRLFIHAADARVEKRRNALRKSVIAYISADTPHGWSEKMRNPADERILLGIASGLLQSLTGIMRTRIQSLLNTAIDIQHMLDMLRNGGAADRAKVAARLFWCQDQSVHAELRKALHDVSPEVVLAAANSLLSAGQQIGISDVFDILKERDMLDHRGARDLLRRLAPVNPRATADAILSEDDHVAVLAIDAVGSVNDPAIFDALRTVARRHRGTDVRAAAIRAFGNLRDNSAAEIVAYGMGDLSWEVRVQAAIAVGRLKLVALAPRLAEYLDSDNWWLQWRAAQSLAMLGPIGERYLRQVPFDSPVAILVDAALADVHSA